MDIKLKIDPSGIQEAKNGLRDIGRKVVKPGRALIRLNQHLRMPKKG